MAMATTPPPKPKHQFHNNPKMPFATIPMTYTPTTTHIQDHSPGQSESQDQVFNFVAGPAVHPKHILRKAQPELYDWHSATSLNLEAPPPPNSPPS
ncbi:phosphoserine aminotransferase 1 [Pyrus ussuriensis x Pyrus communis]|uniref:Phosphoserine aminotransferase 1 n=1 Tax=Pyrus ussuriensis x Pyrus communis TaxID=2448454 RepID=A0A5N5G6Z9_9ROSA|nr:phosphoserine aminotransferase 1 [Pyrus ussuriensis x Pyrus communis]